MAWTFKADNSSKEIKVPYLEEARADYAPYYRSSRGSIIDRNKILNKTKAQVIENLGKLHGSIAGFEEGTFYDDYGRERVGYNVHYFYGDARGVIRVAGLPIKGGITDIKVLQARTQALMIVRDWLEASVTASVFSPGMYALISHLMVDDNHNVAESIIMKGNLPMLSSAKEFGYDGEEEGTMDI